MQPIGFADVQKRLLPTLLRLFGTTQDVQTEADSYELLYRYGREREALLYASLFIPSFEEIDGSILYARTDKELTKKFLAAKYEDKCSLEELEESFNYLETSHVFNAGLLEDLEDQDDLLFAQCVAEAWRARLYLLYPLRKFQISVVGPSESGDAYAICFHEIRPPVVNRAL